MSAFGAGAGARGTKDAPVKPASPATPTQVVHASVQMPSIVETPALPTSEPALELDMTAIAQHAKVASRLVGHPVGELVQLIGPTASIAGDAVEWNLSELGISAGSTYGYANVAGGKITGIVIRGRTTLERAHQIRIRQPMRLTMSGGDRPSFSIDAGE